MPMLPIDINEEDRIAIVAPHPDDESIGAGGLLLRYPAQCTVILMTDGRHGDATVAPSLLRERRYAEFESVIKRLDTNCVVLDYEDGTLSGTEECFAQVDFSVYTKVFLPCADDNHPDHMAACLYAKNRIVEQGIQKLEVYQYEVHLPFHAASHYIDISNVMDRKVELISVYQSQMGIHDYPSQVRALAAYRGCQNNVTGSYLEAYLQLPLAGNMREEGIFEQEKRMEKASQLNRILSKWTDILIDRQRLSEYLQENGVRRVAVYGWGDLGRKLYRELMLCGIEVGYILDQNVTYSGVEGLLVHRPQKGDASVDAVIVTVLGGFSDIRNLLESLGYFNIYSFDSLLDGVRFQLKHEGRESV